MADEEAENANKIQIPLPSIQNNGPKELKIPPSKRANPISNLSQAETDIDRTHTIRNPTDASMTPPKIQSPKAQQH